MSAGDLESGAKTWKGEFCTLRRFPQVVRDGKCQEEIKLSWKNTKTEKIFRLNCPGIHSFIPIVVKKSLIIVGGPNDEFCLFSNDENALYYKISGSWTKFEILIDHVNEQPLQPQEISKVTERILKWKEVIDYANRKEKEYTKGMEDEDQRHAAEMKKCDQSLEEQKEITEKTMQEIKKLRDDEDKIHESKMKEVGKIKDEHAKSEARNNESNRHATRVNEINQKEALEKDRLLNNAGHITNRLHTEELKHKQQSQNFKNLLDQEEERFQMEFNNLKSIGY